MPAADTDLRPGDAEAVLLYANTTAKLGAAISELSHNPALKGKRQSRVSSEILRKLSISSRLSRNASLGSVLSVLDDDDDICVSSDDEELYNVERFPLNALRLRAEKLFDKSDEMFAECLKMPTAAAAQRHVIYRDWGKMLQMRARHKGGLPADVLYDEASQKFEASLAIRPDTAGKRNPAFNEWGASLRKQEENLRVEDSAFFKGKFMEAVVAKCLKEGSTEPMKQFMTGTHIKTELHKELRLKAFGSQLPAQSHNTQSK